MAQQTINIGTTANDGTGDPLRVAFDKTNDNFDELYARSITAPASSTVNAIAVWGDTTAESLLNTSVLIDGSGNITTTGTVNSRDISSDGTKLDTIETNADATTSADVVSAVSGATLTTVSPASGDLVLIQDVSDTNALKVATAQTIADLAGGIGNFLLSNGVATGIDAVNDVDAGTEQITITGHTFAEDDPVVYSNGGGTDIGGLTDTNTYYVIYVDANTIQLESTLGGGAINLSDGVGTNHSLTHATTAIITTGSVDIDINIQPSGTGQLVIDSTSAMRPPIGTTAQRPGTPTEGDLRYNNDDSALEFYDNTSWVSVAANATASSTIFTTANDVLTNFDIGYTAAAEEVLVTINGVIQIPGGSYAYTMSGTEVAFTEAPPTGSVIEVRRLM